MVLKLLFILIFSLTVLMSVISVVSSEDNSLGEVCFDKLGCFSVRDCPVTGKWVNSLPDKPSNINTTFTLKTVSFVHDGNHSIPDGGNSIPDSSEGNGTVKELMNERLISYDDLESLKAINGSQKLAFLIHGFGAIGSHLPALRDELVKIVPQVIMVDWQRGSRLPYFNYAVVNTQVD